MTASPRIEILTLQWFQYNCLHLCLRLCISTVEYYIVFMVRLLKLPASSFTNPLLFPAVYDGETGKTRTKLEAQLDTLKSNIVWNFYRRTVHFEIYVVHSPTNALFINLVKSFKFTFNPLTPNDQFSGRTVPLTSKCCILYIYSTNIDTAYFKRGIYSPYFPLKNAVCSIILTYLVPVLFTFYIQSVLKLKRIIPASKSLIHNNIAPTCFDL